MIDLPAAGSAVMEDEARSPQGARLKSRRARVELTRR